MGDKKRGEHEWDRPTGRPNLGPESRTASVSRPDVSPQPGGTESGVVAEAESASARGVDAPPAHVVLYQPEIPQNTGNIGRTCVATGAKLWIVRPTAFQLDEKRLRRAGLDYWQYLQWSDVPDWSALTESLRGHRFYYFSRFAQRCFWDASFAHGDVFVFGSESCGLPDSLLNVSDSNALRLPTSEQVRSLNLATTVGIALYEHQRQLTQRVGGTNHRK